MTPLAQDGLDNRMIKFLSEVYKDITTYQRVWYDFFGVQTLQATDRSFLTQFWQEFMEASMGEAVKQFLWVTVIDCCLEHNMFVLYSILILSQEFILSI